MKKVIYAILLMIWCAQSMQAQVPAFPGADGYGRYSKGGRGGAVYYVTTLKDVDSVGTFRYAVTHLANATILFKVSGTIHLNSGLSISQSNLTIAGQSAPGDGICIADYPVTVSGSNLIIRYMRFRMGDRKLTADEADGADAFGGRFCSNIIVDHCSISWSTDECASFYANTNFTMQWCIISESLRMSLHSKGAHGYGAIWGGLGASYYHNMMIHHDSRTPRFGTGNVEPLSDHKTDMRNNVIYNWSGNGCYGAEGMCINIINNYYRPGAATTTSSKNRFISIDDATPADSVSVWGKFYINGNINDKYTSVNSDNWTGVVINTSTLINGQATQADVKSDTIIGQVPLLHQHTATGCYEPVLNYVGCSLHRDELDERLVGECRNGTYTFMGASASKGGIIDSVNDLKPANAADDWSPWPTLNSTTPPTDTDEDGMPDQWEEANGLNPNNTEDRNARSSEGYTMLEIYLNSLVDSITTSEYEGSEVTGVAGTPYTVPSTKSDVTLKWTMEKGQEGEAAVISNTALVTSGTYSLGSEIRVLGTGTNLGTFFTKFQPAVEYNQATASTAITYNINLPDGILLVPTGITFSSCRYGTNGCYMDIVWVDNNGNSTTLEQGMHPVANNGTDSPLHEVGLNDVVLNAASGKCQLMFYIYRLSNTKSMGLANIEIKANAYDPTGVRKVIIRNDGERTRIYNLAGQELKSFAHGINIVNGRKVQSR